MNSVAPWSEKSIKPFNWIVQLEVLHSPTWTLNLIFSLCKMVDVPTNTSILLNKKFQLAVNIKFQYLSFTYFVIYNAIVPFIKI